MKIFIVENEENIRKDIKDVVEEVYPDADIDDADGYEKALKKLDGNSYDIIIADLCLSGNSPEYKWEGYDIAEKGTEKNKNVAIIILSGYLQADDYKVVNTNEMLWYEFVAKNDPHWHAELTYTIKRCIHKIQQRFFEPEVLWHVRSVPKSYWIVQLSGFGNKSERGFYTELSVFANTYARDEAKIFASSGGLPYHKEIDKYFNNPTVPSLIISDKPAFEKYILCKSEIIFKLLDEPNSLVNFFREIHYKLSTNVPFEKIKDEIQGGKNFWSKLFKNAASIAPIASQYISFVEKTIKIVEMF